MKDLIDIGDLRAERYRKMTERRKDLEMMIHCCSVLYITLIDIECPVRRELTTVVDKYNKLFQKELEKIKHELS